MIKPNDEFEGFPLWIAERETDDLRTVRIKASKNIISVIQQMKRDGLVISDRHNEMYLNAIRILKQEGEKYP